MVESLNRKKLNDPVGSGLVLNFSTGTAKRLPSVPPQAERIEATGYGSLGTFPRCKRGKTREPVCYRSTNGPNFRLLREKFLISKNVPSNGCRVSRRRRGAYRGNRGMVLSVHSPAASGGKLENRLVVSLPTVKQSGFRRNNSLLTVNF